MARVGGCGRPRPHYANNATVMRTVAAARAAGIDVAGIELSKEGIIRVMEARLMSDPPLSEFDKWNRAGLLD